MSTRKILEVTLVVSVFAFALYAESVALGDFFVPAAVVTTTSTSTSIPPAPYDSDFPPGTYAGFDHCCPLYIPPCAAAWLDNLRAQEHPAPQCVYAYLHGSPSLYPSRHNGIQFK